MLTNVLRVVCWTDQPSRTTPSCSAYQLEYGCECASRVLLRRPGLLPPKLLEQRSALLLFRCHGCVGHVTHGQWTLLGTDMLV